MLEHHRRLIDRTVAELRSDPKYQAIIVGGSIAKGLERPDSDLDLILIATDEEYDRRVAADDFWYYNPDLADYPGGYVEGTVANYRYLLEVADHGSEPARAAFRGAFVPYSQIPVPPQPTRR